MGGASEWRGMMIAFVQKPNHDFIASFIASFLHSIPEIKVRETYKGPTGKRSKTGRMEH